MSHFVRIPFLPRGCVRAWMLALSSLALTTACQRRPSQPFTLSAGVPHALVAHAGGAVGGLPYTNSRQALDASWERGFRLFEIDLSWTTDGKLVLLHDWGPTLHRLCAAPEGPRTLADFHALRMTAGLTALDVQGLETWVRDHPGARIVSDVKGHNVEALRIVATDHPALARRLVPQIYGFREYEPVRSMGYLSIILTLYLSDATDDEVVAFAERHKLLGVTMWPARARNGHFVDRLAAVGVPVYVHTINDWAKAEPLFSLGVHGIYTDLLEPAKLPAPRPAS